MTRSHQFQGTPPQWLASPIALLAAACLLAGCSGGDEFTTAPVSGTVTMNGKPVTKGTIMLTPIPGEEQLLSGKSASARLQDDGTFVLGTYGEDDGAVIGKHRVSYMPPLGGEAAPAGGHGSPIAKSPYVGAKPKQQEVEITDGDNVLEIELVK